MVDVHDSTSTVILVLTCIVGAVIGASLERFERQVTRNDSPTKHKPYRTAISAALFAMATTAVVAARGLSAETLELFMFMGVLLLISLVDLESRRIPNKYIAAALVIRLLYWIYAFVMGLVDISDIGYYLVSALGIGAALLVVTLIADMVFHQESMGGGDLKLYAVAALYFGWQNTLVVVFCSCMIALAGWAIARIFTPNASETASNTMPFGPAIAAACIVPMVLQDAARLFSFL